MEVRPFVVIFRLTMLQCFTLEKYVHAAQSLWLHKWPDTVEKQSILPIMITTESPSVSKDELAFSGRKSPAPWQKLQFKFLHNTFDIQQDTGLMAMRNNKHESLDQVMLSSLSSLRAQLSHRLLMLNCCSNFHYLMHMLAESGCGQRWDTEVVCLKDHPVEDFRLCKFPKKIVRLAPTRRHSLFLFYNSSKVANGLRHLGVRL